MSERILILAPRGRDAQVIETVIVRGGIKAEICPDLSAVRSWLERDVGGVLITEEALAVPEIETIAAWCEAQPSWSDLPVIVLATKQSGPRPPLAASLIGRLGNVVLLERPLNAETLASAARSAIRGRLRQYQTRGLLLERERSEAALRELNETLERRVEERASDLERAGRTLAFALESAELGSWDLDLEHGGGRHSAHHDRIFGYAERVPAWSWPIFLAHVVEEDQGPVTAAFDAALAGGSFAVECRIRRADNAVRWVAVKGRVEYDGDHRPVRMAGVLMDTTERRYTEDALHQAQKMEAIGQLTGGVAHDFNNLLTVIVGGLDMVIRHPERTDRVIRLAEGAMTAARRGEQLTQQLLAFSRRQMLRPSTLDPNRLLLEFRALAQRAVGEMITLRFDLAPGVHPIRVDPAQFESAVLNLVVNARDAMPEGGMITISTQNLHRTDGVAVADGMAPGDGVLVSVADTGTGIDDATLVRAFEPFFTTKDVGKGSGLGLSQVYGFARSAGGHVAIESGVGRGTIVRLSFPRSGEMLADDAPALSHAAPLERAASGETVLLVEDDDQVRSMAIESLAELSYRVVVARNAREALQQIDDTQRIDILFSDVVMPGGMNGVQLAKEARRRRPEMKILLTSGYVGALPADQAIGDDLTVLNKPYRRDELAQKLRAALA